jgi:formylglycine-generating enzyme required for sulfatase activity
MTEIPGYRIKRELGHGGMATVFLATQESLDRSVALKVMAPSLAADQTFTARFIKEGKTIAKFNHPHIVGVYDVGVAEQHHYIAMEHISGGDLKRRLKARGALEPTDALRIMIDVSSALNYAHKQGFVHRDVKSENILFRDDGSAVLTDFGIAKAADSGTRMTGTGMSIGTPHYMSPEQARGKPVDGRSDIYSLGIVLYEMLTGKVPYQADDSVAIGIMHVSQPVPSLPPDLAEYDPMMKKMLAKDPRERYQTAEELADAANQLLKGKQVSATTIGEAAPPRQVNQFVIWGAFAAVLLIGVGIGYFTLQPPGQYVETVGGGRVLINEPMDSVQGSTLAEGRAILQVKTNPPAAEVQLDGHVLGTTPTLSAKLPAGKHTLTITHKYFRLYEEEVELIEDKVLKRDITLLPGRGSVTLLSDPPNAQIFINGKLQAERTPATIVDIAAGDHEVLMRLERYKDAVVKVEILEGQTVRESITLAGGELVKVGERWVDPAEASDEFLALASTAADSGDLETVRQYLSQAQVHGGGDMPEGGAAILKRAEEINAKTAGARKEAAAQRKKAEAAMAAFDKENAIRYYQAALAAFPDDKQAMTGLEKARSLRKPGSAFRDVLRDGSIGPEMIVIAPGRFTMGSPAQEPGRDKNEGPQREVTFKNPIAVGKYEVTFEEYDQYAKAMNKTRPTDRGWGRGRRPVINVSWNEAQEYVQWLSKVTGATYRLPSEAEWEFLARGGTTTTYWWGNKAEQKRANCDGCRSEWDEKQTLPVGSFEPNPLGLFDTAGNVFEWTQDCVNNNYRGAPTDGSAWLEGNCSRRIMRGGSWYFGPRSNRSAARAHNTRNYRTSNVGFRVVRELP